MFRFPLLTSVKPPAPHRNYNRLATASTTGLGRVLGLGLLVVGGSCLWATAAQANTLTVTSTADDNSSGTLRSVLAQANSGDVIQFQLGSGTQTITLNPSLGRLSINQNLTLVGPVAGSGQQVIISGNNATPLLSIPAGVTASLENLTLTGGSANTGQAAKGAGIANFGSLTLTNSIIKGNTTHNDGGGIYNAGTLTISNSTFSNNTALVGGAIENGAGTLTVSNSTFTGNSATSSGGAILSTGNLTLTNNTFSGNSASSGGAVWTGYQTATLLNNTLVMNAAGKGDGGGLFVFSGIVNLANSIIDGNTGGDESGSLAVNTNNLISSALPLNKIINTTLALNGAAAGAPLTYALVAGGPAVNAGTTTLNQVFGNLPTTDERGMPRISGVTVDIGAYELQQANAVYTVSSTMDDSSGKTLRDMVNLVNNRGIGTIVFAPNVFTGVKTITLKQGQLNLNSNITIVGPNQGVIISGNNASRVMNIPAGVTVNLSHLTITKGNENGDLGGGINNIGNLTLSNSTLSGNTAGSGGAIHNNGTLVLSNSTLSGNTASASGGGIFNYSGTSTLSNSTLSGNAAPNGAGIDNEYGRVTLSNSTLSSNTATDAGEGGGIFNYSGTFTLSNSTLSGNTAPNGGAAGGIANVYGGTATLLNNTIVLNQASITGGVYNYLGTMYVANSLIAGNTANNNESDLNGNPAININNLIGDQISPTPPINSIINTTLALNGAPFGSPLTHALVAGSPAINKGDNFPGAPFGNLPTTDERGKPRIDNGIVDIGAFEF